MRAVYIVAALNFCIDALLLAGTALLAGRALHPARLLAASALGAAYAGACLLPQLHALAGLPGRLTCLGLMAMAAYGPDGKTGGAFILLTMALGITPERRARWCRPIEPGFLAELNQRKPTSMEAFARLWYARSGGTSSDWRRCAERHYDHSRYHLLNLHAAFSTERPAHTIEFRAFNGTLHAGEIKAYIQLCLAISAQALTSKAASPTRPVTDNPKYTFRCWLLRLGFIGDEFATAREHLLKSLPGNAAWRQAS